MIAPPEPWVVTTPDKVRAGAIVKPFIPTPDAKDDLLFKIARQDSEKWTRLDVARQHLEDMQNTAWFLTENRRAVVVCAAADLLPTRAPSARFPTPCARCGAGTYTGASVVEHDGPCGGTP